MQGNRVTQAISERQRVLGTPGRHLTPRGVEKPSRKSLCQGPALRDTWRGALALRCGASVGFGVQRGSEVAGQGQTRNPVFVLRAAGAGLGAGTCLLCWALSPLYSSVFPWKCEVTQRAGLRPSGPLGSPDTVPSARCRAQLPPGLLGLLGEPGGAQVHPPVQAGPQLGLPGPGDPGRRLPARSALPPRGDPRPAPRPQPLPAPGQVSLLPALGLSARPCPSRLRPAARGRDRNTIPTGLEAEGDLAGTCSRSITGIGVQAGPGPRVPEGVDLLPWVCF